MIVSIIFIYVQTCSHANSFDYVKLYMILFFVFFFLFLFFYINVFCKCYAYNVYTRSFQMDIKSVCFCVYEWIFKRSNVTVLKQCICIYILTNVEISFLLLLFHISCLANDRSSTYIASCVFCAQKKEGK